VNSVFFVSRDDLFLIGMALAGLADFIDIRCNVFLQCRIDFGRRLLVLLLCRVCARKKSEWQRILHLLKTGPSVPGVSSSRPATLADMDALNVKLPQLASLKAEEKESFLSTALILEAPQGTMIVQHGETGDAAYFILNGSTAAAFPLKAADIAPFPPWPPETFSAIIAALKGLTRTADVVAQESTTLLKVPAETLRGLMTHPAIASWSTSVWPNALIAPDIIRAPRFAGVDQQDAVEVRTEKYKPILRFLRKAGRTTLPFCNYRKQMCKLLATHKYAIYNYTI
jgi:hypothetical protein